jgi:hypothetical protein
MFVFGAFRRQVTLECAALLLRSIAAKTVTHFDAASVVVVLTI